MILRGLAGAAIGICYGFVVSVVVFLLISINLDETKSGGVIWFDPVAMTWFATVISGLIAGGCATLVGVVVGMAGVAKGKAATIGFFAGLLVLGLLSMNSWSSLPMSRQDWIALMIANPLAWL